MSEKKVISGYKGFNQDFTCRDFQYEVGKEYETDRAVVCECGFHFCEFPLDVFSFYPPSNNGQLSKYAKVDGSGIVLSENTKSSCTHISIKEELNLNELIKESVNYILRDVNKYNIYIESKYRSLSIETENKSAAINTGYYSAAYNTGSQSAAINTGNYSVSSNTGNESAAINTGYQSAAINTGYYSASTNTGNYSASTNTGDYSASINTGDYSESVIEGKESIAIVTGIKSKAKGKLGCWIVLTERDINYHIKCVKAFKVDGEKIKEDTFYTLIDGEPKECSYE